MRFYTRILATGCGCVAVALLSACGDSNTTASDTPTQSAVSTHIADSTAPPTASSSTSEPKAPAVGGPRLPAATSTRSDSSSSLGGRACGEANGPEGSLRVSLLSGSASCDQVVQVAKQYGPMISAGKEKRIDGWDCELAQTTGVLARCTKGDSTFGFLPQ